MQCITVTPRSSTHVACGVKITVKTIIRTTIRRR